MGEVEAGEALRAAAPVSSSPSGAAASAWTCKTQTFGFFRV